MTTTVQVDLLKICHTFVAIANGVRILLSCEVDYYENKNDLKKNESDWPPSALWWKVLVETLHDFKSLRQLDVNLVEALFLDESLHDPLLWEECAQACYFLHVTISKYKEKINPNEFADVAKMLQEATDDCRSNSEKLWMIVKEFVKDQSSIHAKPQTLYAHRTPPVVQNSRATPFVPKVHLEKPFGITPLPIILADVRQSNIGDDQSNNLPSVRLKLCEGHGLSDFNEELNIPNLSRDVVAPPEYCPHLYKSEIQSFQYTDDQLKVQNLKDSFSPLFSQPYKSFRLVETAIELEQLVEEFVRSSATKIAISLINHSYRSFSGYVTVMSISFPVRSAVAASCNCLLDTLKLDQRDVNRYIAPIFANPSIVKIFHGAPDSIKWLQRDFGIYVVNLFDTREAARLLSFPLHTYDSLLKLYSDATVVHKPLHFYDWRQRPLTSTLQNVAMDRATYLLQIYDRIKIELSSTGDTNMVRSIFETGRVLSLQRYTPEPFTPSDYEFLIPSSLLAERYVPFSDHDTATTQYSVVSIKQKNVLRRLWDWRDSMAREQDESVAFVCDASFLRDLALECPKTVAELKSFSPARVPQYVLQYAEDIICCIKDAVEEKQCPEIENLSGHSAQLQKSGFRRVEETQQKFAGLAPSSAFFKPMNPSKDLLRNREMMSPVLGTEALYNQAGWMTPQEQHHMTQSTNNKRLSKQTESSRPGQDSNITGSRSPSGNKVTQIDSNVHDLQTSSRNQHDTKIISSLATAAVDDMSMSVGADTSASLLLSTPAIGGRIATLLDDDDDGIDDDGPMHQQSERESENALHETNFAIPNSIREIYNISNRNRLYKHYGATTHELDAKELQELEEADALLRERTLMNDKTFNFLFDDSSVPTSSGRDSEESVPDSNLIQDDLSFMKEIGWIQDENDLNILMDFQTQSNARRADAGTSTSELSVGRDHSPTESNSESATESPLKGNNSLSSESAFTSPGGSLTNSQPPLKRGTM